MSYRKKLTSPEDAVTLIRSGMRVFVSGNAATPIPLLRAWPPARTSLGTWSSSISCNWGKTPSPPRRWRGTLEGAPSSWAPPIGRR